MKPAALAAGLVALACCAKAQAQSFSELALDGRPDRLQRLVAGAKKEGALTLYTSIPEKDMAVLATDFDRRYGDRKSTRLNSSHPVNSYAVFCLEKKNTQHCHPKS